MSQSRCHVSMGGWVVPLTRAPRPRGRPAKSAGPSPSSPPWTPAPLQFAFGGRRQGPSKCFFNPGPLPAPSGDRAALSHKTFSASSAERADHRDPGPRVDRPRSGVGRQRRADVQNPTPQSPTGVRAPRDRDGGAQARETRAIGRGLFVPTLGREGFLDRKGQWAIEKDPPTRPTSPGRRSQGVKRVKVFPGSLDK